MYWHRSKQVGGKIVEESMNRGLKTISKLKRTFTREEIEEITGKRQKDKKRQLTETKIFKKASHRHASADEKKRYEFRIFYEEFGEILATFTAFTVIVLADKLTLEEGAFRLLASLAMEYCADCLVWTILETESYTVSVVRRLEF